MPELPGGPEPIHGEPWAGDVRHSMAETELARRELDCRASTSGDQWACSPFAARTFGDFFDGLPALKKLFRSPP